MRDHYDFTDAKRAPETDGGQGLVADLLVIADKTDALADLLAKDGHKFGVRNRVREAAARIAALEKERDAAEKRALEAEKDAERVEIYEEALRQIVQWADAYPKAVFKEPDWQAVRAALECAGISIDAVSASNMRHVVDGVGKIARAAIDAAHHVPVPTLICPKCGADRYKVPCGHYAGWHPDCPMAGTAAIDAAKGDA